jgi:hypothetical protein
MQTQLLHDEDGRRTFALVFKAGDELMAGVLAYFD